MFGHRGASAHAPENTVAAFRMAGSLGADGVELDVRRTADGHLVVYHDAVIPGVGPLCEASLAEIVRVEPDVCTFSEAMQACAGLIVNVEIKNSPADPDFDPTDSVASAVVAWLSDNEWSHRVVVSSFNPATVDRVRHLTGEIATGQLIDAGSDAAEQLLRAHRRGHQALHPHVSSLGEAVDIAQLARDLGMWVLAWTVNDPASIQALRDAGITGVITDDPAMARSSA